MTFNDNSPQRRLYYQAVNALIHISLDGSLEPSDYLPSMSRMFGPETIRDASSSVNGDIKFFGLSALTTKLNGLRKHQKMIESYQKLQKARKES